MHSARSRWYIKLTPIVSSAMFIVNILGLPRAMWAGIACMSVSLPFTQECLPRAKDRGLFNIVGCVLFIALYLILPESMYSLIGIIGGIGVGYSAGYKWQTAFNTFWSIGYRILFIWYADGGGSAYWYQCAGSPIYGCYQ